MENAGENRQGEMQTFYSGPRERAFGDSTAHEEVWATWAGDCIEFWRKIPT
jgi:hypothetical protein